MRGITIGIDLGYSSSRTGFAAVRGGKLVYSFARQLEGKFVGQKIHSFRNMIEGEIQAITQGKRAELSGPRDIRMLVWEEPYAGMRNALRALSRIEGVLYLLCEDLMIPYTPVNNQTLKKALVPDIKPVKHAMRIAAKALSGKEFTEDMQDEADATLCAYYGEGLE